MLQLSGAGLLSPVCHTHCTAASSARMQGHACSQVMLPKLLLQAQSHIRRQQPCFSAVLAVLVLAVAVAEATDNQLPHIKPPNLPNLSWEKLPFVGRFSKAAQAAKAAAAAITVSHALPKTPSLPPAPPVAGLAQPPAAGSQAVLLGQLDSSKFKAGSNKKGKDLKQLPTTGKNETQAGCSCLTDWENKPGGSKMNGCQNPDNDPLVRPVHGV